MSGFSWTPHASFCVGRGICPSLLPLTSAKGKFGGFRASQKRPGWGEAMGLGQEFCSLKGLSGIAPLNVFDQRPPNILLLELQRVPLLLIGQGRQEGFTLAPWDEEEIRERKEYLDPQGVC